MTPALSHSCVAVIFPNLMGSALVYAAVVLVPVCLLGCLVHFLLSLPMRRRERARFFVDLVETALARGDSVERTLVDMAASRDRSPGVLFHLLAAHLEQGARLDEALRRVPGYLPPQISAILQAGQQTGDLRRVLPACREIVQDGHSSVRSAESYAMVLLLTFSPFAIWITCLLFAFVVPKLRAIMGDFEEIGPPVAGGVWDHPAWILIPQSLACLTLVVAAFIHIAGSRATRWCNFGPLPIADWIAWQVPWKRQRLQRTFSRMLSAFLDGGMPEAAALTLAADCTANRIMQSRARRAAAALASGTKLPAAVATLDGHGEFLWRLRNAMHSAPAGFVRALQGWHDHLEAHSFRAEQTAAHIITTALVILNGVIVASIALATFGSLIAILNAGALW